ncbi:MAG: site-specific integrase, partial [Chloroflexota bacterium]
MKAYLEAEEVAMMERAASNLRDKLLVRLLFHLGCRITEALSLKPDDIDFEQGTVTIVHLKSRVNLSCISCGQQLGRHHAFCPKCGGKIGQAQVQQQEHRRQRVLPVDNETLIMLKEYIKRGGPVVKEG